MIIDALKICSICREGKPLSEFHKQPNRKDGRHPYCRRCYNSRYSTKHKKYSTERRRIWDFPRKYGITPQQADDMLTNQGGVCAICKTIPNRKCIDHCHKTGKVRGILCHRCNIFVAALDDTGFRISAMKYLDIE